MKRSSLMSASLSTLIWSAAALAQPAVPQIWRIQVFDNDGKLLRAVVIDVPFDHAVKTVIGNPVDPNAKTGTFSPGVPWAIACPSKNVLYVAELLNWRVQKLLLRPGN